MSLRRFAIHTAYCLTMLLTLGSCTFDYFEDDMNYKVFVPRVQRADNQKLPRAGMG